jgi:hypothetical protein
MRRSDPMEKATWHQRRVGRDNVDVPQTSRALVVETRKVTRFEPGTSHALGVRWLLPRPRV